VLDDRYDGVDASEAIVERLHAKEVGVDIDVTMGDMATVALSGAHRLLHGVVHRRVQPNAGLVQANDADGLVPVSKPCDC
jgi:hypothetical protein